MAGWVVLARLCGAVLRQRGERKRQQKQEQWGAGKVAVGGGSHAAERSLVLVVVSGHCCDLLLVDGALFEHGLLARPLVKARLR